MILFQTISNRSNNDYVNKKERNNYTTSWYNDKIWSDINKSVFDYFNENFD